MSLTKNQVDRLKARLKTSFNKVSFGIGAGQNGGFALAVRTYDKKLSKKEQQAIKDEAQAIIGRPLAADELNYRHAGVVRPRKKR